MVLKKLAKSGLEYSFDKKYEKLLSQKSKSYNDWIIEKEAELERFDMSVFDWQAEILTDSTSVNKNSEYVCKYNNLSFHIVPMEMCCFGYNVRQYIEDVVVFVNGILSETAIPLIGKFFETHSRAIAVYGDEDILSASGERINPYFKSDFSPNELLSHFYFCNLVAIRRISFRDMDWTGEMTGAKSLYHNLVRMIYSDSKFIDYGVGHVDEVLIHAKDYANDSLSDEAAVRFAAKLKDRNLVSKKGAERSISVVICTKDHPDMLERCLTCLEASSGDFAAEYIVVDNGSTEENREKNANLSKRIAFKYIFEPAEFNFSAMCNRGASDATGDLLLFLNDDVEITDTEVLEKLWDETSYGFTGASGIKLLYPENNKIQHTGIVNTPPGPVHKLQGMEDNTDYYHGFNSMTTNRIAVTGACLCIRRSVFESIGGFDIEFPVAYNDVDLCYRLLEKGYYIACCNSISAIHKESVTRGADVSADKAKRLLSDRERLYSLHPLIGRRDPFFNRHLLSEALDARIVPANLYSVDAAAETPVEFAEADFSGAREDKCLFVTVEFAGKERDILGTDTEEYLLQGYGVLTGSNNACYSKQILLESKERTIAVSTAGCVRQDLKAAFPEEKNTELSGFCFRLSKEALPKGTYRIGMMAKRELSSEKIYNYTDKYLVTGE